jgi:hypothetical protein
LFNDIFYHLCQKVLYGWIIHPINMSSLNARQISLLSVLTAVTLGIQLAPRPVPNVEATSLFTFLVGFLYGGVVGGFFGGFVMFVNGFLSPWGPAELNMPFQMAGMALIGLAGGIYQRSTPKLNSVRVRSEVAVLGAFITVLYDVITNAGVAVGYNILGGVPIGIALISTFSTGVFFSLIHVGSNTVLFASGFVPLLKALQSIPGGEILWSRRELLRS